MKHPAFLLVILCLIASCSPDSTEITSKQIARRCQMYHDSKDSWYGQNLEIELTSQSVFSDNNEEVIQLKMNNASKTFEYNNLYRGVHLEYGPNGCIDHNEGSNCDSYQWTYNFYPYIWGMSSKFFDPGVMLQEEFEEETINEIPVYVIHINYEAENYDFYINRESYYLEGFKFVKNDGSGGEIVFNEGSRNVNGMILPTKKIWYDLDMNLLGTDILN